MSEGGEARRQIHRRARPRMSHGGADMGFGPADDRRQNDKNIFVSEMIRHPDRVELVLADRLLSVGRHLRCGTRRIELDAKAHGSGLLAILKLTIRWCH